MTAKHFFSFPHLWVLLLMHSGVCAAQSLQVTYGASGIQTLSYGGTLLEDIGAHPEDSFHIWHMKATDLQGNVLSTGQYGWGEQNAGRSWDSGSHTWTYLFSWGSITAQFQQVGNNLNVIVTETNNAGSGIIFDGATLYPFALHFPQSPLNFSGGNAFADNTSAPGVTVADYGSGEAIAVAPDASKPLYSGFQPTGSSNAYTALISSTSPDSLATFLPHNDRPVAPGQSDTFVVSLRLTPSGTAPATLAADAYASWDSVYPAVLQWPDRRIIGTVYLASSPSGPANQPAGYPNNPRRYFNDGNNQDFDVTTSAGLAAFQQRVLQQAAANVANLQQLNAQGAITWDIEGEQYPQATSYVCSPDQIAQVAPEMESIITDSTSQYAGMKLDDAYFKTMSDAGFRIGVCIRPQQFTLNADGTAGQTYLPVAQIPAQLIRKMKYAHDRWGATIFYVDSTVDTDGGTLDAGIFQQVQAALPDSLIIPEETTPRHFAYSAPFASFLFHTDLGTASSVYAYYPSAFSANLVNDVDPNTLAQYEVQLTDSVRRGDILMVHADYWQANNPTVMSMYQTVGVTTSAQAHPVVTWPAPASIAYSTPLTSAQLNATASIPGTFVYSPSPGTVLPVGTNRIFATFTPADSTHYSSSELTTILTVSQATPTLAWPAPAAIPYGTALSATQLNATASVAGTFSYSSPAGSVLPAGNNTITATFTPADQVDFAVTTISVNLSVQLQAPTITFLISNHTTHDAPFTVQAASNSTGAFTYTVLSGPAIIFGAMVTVTGPGTVVLQAAQVAQGNYGPGVQTASFTVTSGSLWLGKSNAIFDVLSLMGQIPSSSAMYAGSGLGMIAHPQGMAFDHAGNIWIASSNGLSVFSSSGTSLTQSPYTTGGVNAPLAIAIDGAGTAWVANANSSVSAMTSSGTALTPATGLPVPGTSTLGGLAIDTSGNVWVSNVNDDSVTEFLGVAAPVAPLSTSLTNRTVGARP